MEQLLGLLRTAAEQYGTLAQRYKRVIIDKAAMDALLAVPVELWLTAGLVAACLCSWAGAARARRAAASQRVGLESALQCAERRLQQRTHGPTPACTSTNARMRCLLHPFPALPAERGVQGC